MATNTYVALDKITTTGSVASVTFSSINQDYTDLIVVANVQQVTDGEDFSVRLNGDTGTNYSRTFLCGDASTAHGGCNTSVSSIIVDHHATPPTTGSFSVNVINLQNYSNTTTYKTIVARSNSLSTYGGTVAVAGLWRNTAAVTSITLLCTNSSNIKIGSTFSLYGIAANDNAFTAQATGGTITADAGYIYHTFTSTGTFTPTVALTCDYVVVAGGGGGGTRWAGGGGAGGMRSTFGATGGSGSLETPISVTATAYTITVGGPGAGGTGTYAAGTQGSNSTFSTITSTGGGAGGTLGGAHATTGGSGGAGGMRLQTFPAGQGAAGTSGQGYNGGNAATSGGYAGGGGGGAGAIGETADNNNPSNAGNGGAGRTIFIGGSTLSLAGGGGGGSENGGTYYGDGGLGGGGNGNSSAGQGANATANTGGGGGGGGNDTGTGGAGGSGIVIVRYAK